MNLKENGPYRKNTAESIDSLKQTIAELQQEKEEREQRWNKKQSKKERRQLRKIWFKELFYYDSFMRAWLIWFLVIGVIILVIGGAVALDKHFKKETRKYIRGLNPPAIGCVKVEGEIICITPDYKLLHCDSDGCAGQPLLKPENI